MIQKTQEFKARGSLLRNEGRHRPIVAVGVVVPARAKPDPAAVEAEDRGAIEAIIGTRSVFVTSAVDPEIVIVLEPFRMRQEHDADGKSPET